MRFLKIAVLVLVTLLASCNASKSEAEMSSMQNQNQAAEQQVPSLEPEQSDAPLPGAAEKTQSKNDENLRGSYFQCLDSAAGITPKIQDCIDEELAFQDKRLSDIHQRMINSADKQGQFALKTAQEEWLIDRDQSCSSDGQGGQGASLETNGCVLERTAKRATELEAQSKAL